MQRIQRTLVVLAALLASTAPVLALSEVITNEREENRRLLEKYRTTDPEKYIRLLQELEVFRSLPPEVQDQVRKLDRDLRKEDSATREHLLDVLRRYDAWIQTLPAAERERINLAQNPKERLQIIRKIREREWLERLPAADRKRIQEAREAERPRLIQETRQAEQQRRHDWQITLRFWKEILNHEPLPAENLPDNVKAFVKDVLRPLLTEEEKERLKSAEGKWPRYPRILVELADKHPISIPGPTGPARWNSSVEKDVRKHIKGKKTQIEMARLESRLRAVDGKWPDFGVVLLEVEKEHVKKGQLLPRDVQPSQPKDFSPAIQKFITDELVPVLDAKENERLKNAETKWPNYPEILLELARKHGLQVPEMALPGPRESWDRFRLKFPPRVGMVDEPRFPSENLAIANVR